VIEFLPTYLIREQAAVGALVVFGVSRIVAAGVLQSKGWRISIVEMCFLGIAALYCVVPLLGLIAQPYQARSAMANFEGNVIGCAIALFFSPILSHRLGFE
jgi:hypothetical protein